MAANCYNESSASLDVCNVSPLLLTQRAKYCQGNLPTMFQQWTDTARASRDVLWINEIATAMRNYTPLRSAHASPLSHPGESSLLPG